MESRLPATVVSSILLLLSAKSGAVTFEVTNAAVPNTTGGERFNKDIGLDYAKALSDVSILIWNTFNQRNPTDRNPVDTVTLIVEDEDNGMVAFTSGSTIHLSAQYVGDYSDDVKTEVTGLLFHETTHVWQWDGQGQANPALVEGIADFIRLKAGWYAVEGGSRDRIRGMKVTARFLLTQNSDVSHRAPRVQNTDQRS
ncbi:hypothetical protein BAE44_0024240 [Dichanthelium oligosanthes]|uniref:Plant basic secretory protein (BSP) family protein n=1 Tax=Dichanthelium oligosanthes TaxID=888268 RepID=A0A1E5UPI2_9POAL|nr:hypothetical protein BAE44_0024240 [Dichanthelium oligosanthes]